MPTYEFKCETCSTTGTITQSMTETAYMKCPRCLKDMQQVYSAPGLIFRGGGWGGSN